MKETIKKIISQICFSETSQIIDLIKKSRCNIVSFDIFDTLIKRNVQNPTDVFSILERNYCMWHDKHLEIKKMRIEAEYNARKKTKEDVNIDEIYSCFLGISDDEKQWLINEEIRIEKAVCQKNFEMGKIYDWCIANDYCVIITSDMYLPEKKIIEILNDAGYEKWDKLYLSNKLRKCKSTGSIFKYILDDKKVNSKNMIHIGDSLKGDYLVPKKMNIKSILISAGNIKTKYENKKYISEEKRNGNTSYNVVNSFVKNNLNSSYTFYQKLGYEVIGPILYGYCKWLEKILCEHEIDKVFFLAREGFILKEASDIFGMNKLKCFVVRVSRKATSLPRLYKASDIRDLMNKITVSRINFTVNDLLLSCNIDDKHSTEIERKCQVSLDADVRNLSDSEKKSLFNILKPYIDEISKEQEKNIHGYFKQFDFSGNVAVCDVGWHGTIQNSLRDIFPDVNITGFYIGGKDRDENKEKMISFLFDDSFNHCILKDIMSSPDLFELFFLSTDGTAKYYEMDQDGKYYCVQELPEQSDENAQNILDLQRAAYKFVSDFQKLDKKLNIDMDPMVCTAAYSKFINPPSNETVDQFKCFSFYNITSSPLVSKHGLLYYIIRPKQFVSDFLNHGCKTLFLKNIFKLPLPYADLIDFMRNFDKK